MKLLKDKNTLLILSVFIYFTLTTLAFFIAQYSLKSVKLNTQIAEAMTVEGSTDLAIAELLQKLSFSLYEGATDRVTKHQLLVDSANELKNQAEIFTFIFFIVSATWLLFHFFIAKHEKNKDRFWRHVLIISILCLFIGLIAPMMQMTAYKDLPVLGEVVFKYEAKSIFSTVQSLFSHGSILIAALITLLSIFVPLLKMAVVAMNLFNVAPSLHRRAHDLIHLLGKWSMADVFVVAILISIFALDTQDFTRAETDLGVYFFTAYCLLSLLVTQMVLKENIDETILD